MEVKTDTNPTEDELEIPAKLKREPQAVEKIADEPIELVREFVTVEEEGGKEVTDKE